MEDNSELFIHLGYNNNTHIFSHLIHNAQDYKPDISWQIYNNMIHNNLIKSYNDVVLIFDIYNDAVNVITLVHSKGKKKEYSLYEVKKIYKRLINESKKLVIKYDYALKCYLTFYIENINNKLCKLDCIKLTDVVQTSKDILVRANSS
jgi:hypothetical protein